MAMVAVLLSHKDKFADFVKDVTTDKASGGPSTGQTIGEKAE